MERKPRRKRAKRSERRQYDAKIRWAPLPNGKPKTVAGVKLVREGNQVGVFVEGKDE